ncbi:MAG: LapA family protein [Acidimicrobiales bacterium]
MAVAPQDPERPARRRRQLSGGAIASLGGVGLLLIFIFQNTEKIRLHFLVFAFTWPLWLYTIITAIFGALVWLGLGVMRRHRRRKERRENRRGD